MALAQPASRGDPARTSSGSVDGDGVARDPGALDLELDLGDEAAGARRQRLAAAHQQLDRHLGRAPRRQRERLLRRRRPRPAAYSKRRGWGSGARRPVTSAGSHPSFVDGERVGRACRRRRTGSVGSSGRRCVKTADAGRAGDGAVTGGRQVRGRGGHRHPGRRNGREGDGAGDGERPPHVSPASYAVRGTPRRRRPARRAPSRFSRPAAAGTRRSTRNAGRPLGARERPGTGHRRSPWASAGCRTSCTRAGDAASGRCGRTASRTGSRRP